MKRLSLMAVAALFIAGQAAALETVGSKYKAEVYGTLRMDMQYVDRGTAAPGEWTLYTNSGVSEDSDFRVTARDTRLGVNISDSDRINGKVEIDFWGQDTGGSSGSTADIRMRHAYVNMHFDKVDLLAGQTWQLTPLELPDTNNGAYMAYSGCLWQRVPQMRATMPYGDYFTFAAAVARPTRKTTDSEGTASGRPEYEASVAAKVAGMTFTLMGAYGEWKNATNQVGRTKLGVLGYNVPLGKLAVNGQLWYGQNLYDFMGGVGQMGYDGSEVRARGGFMGLKYTFSPAWTMSAAAGMDDPENAYVVGSDTSPGILRNSTVFINAGYMVFGKVRTIFEVAQNFTEYKYADHSSEKSSNRYQLTFMFPF